MLFSLLLSLVFPCAAAPSALERGREFYLQGRSEEALRSIHNAVQRSTTDVEARLDLGVMYRDAGRAMDAASAFEEAAALRPADPDVWTALGEAALQARDLDRAAASFARALGLMPKHYYGNLGMGRTRFERGDSSGAAKNFDAASRERPSAALPQFYLGRAHLAKGSLDAAKLAFQESLRRDNQFSEVRLHLGALLVRQKAVDQAWIHFAKAADLEPGNAAARRGKASLDAVITKKPEELIPTVRIAAARRVVPAPRAGVPLLKVAIGTSVAGKPVALKAVSIRSSGDFTFSPKAGGAPLAIGHAGEVWVLRKASKGAGYEILGPGNVSTASFTAPIRVAPVDTESDTLILDAVPSAQGYAWAALKDREVRESVEVRPQGGGFALFNDVHIEDYLYGVVAEEMPVAWPPEATNSACVRATTA